MSMALTTLTNKWHKNGIWFFTKIANRIVGQDFYDANRVQRRILSNKFYYLRQQWLFRLFSEKLQLANLIGIYPKCNNTHGYGNEHTYEMYRDFQENTINSDGSFSMWIVYVSAIYCLHTTYNYFLPWYWIKTNMKNGEEERLRLKDAIASTILEDSYGIQMGEWGWNPHDFHAIRMRLTEGLSHPDDVRAMAVSALNRRHRYREHYLKKIGENQTRMIGPV